MLESSHSLSCAHLSCLCCLSGHGDAAAAAVGDQGNPAQLVALAARVVIRLLSCFSTCRSPAVASRRAGVALAVHRLAFLTCTLCSRVQKKLQARSERVKSVDFHPTEPWVLSALYSGHVFIWNYQTQTLVKSIEVRRLESS